MAKQGGRIGIFGDMETGGAVVATNYTKFQLAIKVALGVLLALRVVLLFVQALGGWTYRVQSHRKLG